MDLKSCTRLLKAEPDMVVCDEGTKPYSRNEEVSGSPETEAEALVGAIVRFSEQCPVREWSLMTRALLGDWGFDEVSDSGC